MSARILVVDDEANIRALVDEILSDDPQTYLTNISRQCSQIHTAVYQSYVAYPIESALPA